MKEKRRMLSSVKPDDLTPQSPGKPVQIADGWAFVPGHLPPAGLSLSIMAVAEEARGAVGELVGQARLVQNPELIIAPFRREEAVLSSRIDRRNANGDQDLLLAEATPGEEIVEDSDTFEVLNCPDALVMGEGWIAEGRPLNYTLITGLHAELLHGVRGRDKHPGTLRTTLVYIGDRGRGVDAASYIPPPPEQVPPLMDDLLQFLQAPPSFSPLSDELSITSPTARHAIETLDELQILRPARRGPRGRQLWVAQELLDTVHAA